MSRVCLVTGGGGLLGKGLKDLLREKYKNCIEKNEYEFITNSEDTNEIQKYYFLNSRNCDLKDYKQAEIWFQNFNFTDIIHFAAQVGGLYANQKNNLNFLQNNLDINLNVVKLCHKYNVRRGIFTLSTCVFPEKCDLPLTEEKIHDGRCHLSNEGYSIAKRVLEVLVRFYREQYKYEWICIIPTNIYGKHDNFHLQNGHVIPSIIHKIYLAKKQNIDVKLMGSGKAIRQFIYSEDVNKILFYILNTYYSKNQTIIKDNIYNIIFATNLPSNELSIRELAEKIKYYLNFEKEILFDTTKDDGIFKKTASNANLMKILDSSFSFTDLDTGLQKTIEWFISSYDEIRS